MATVLVNSSNKLEAILTGWGVNVSVAMVDTDAVVFVYTKSERESFKVAGLLRTAGYKDVRLDGRAVHARMR